MKNKIYLIIGLLIISLFLVSCNQSATFGDGDSKFSVELIDGNYELNDGVGKDVVISGNLNLKLCNKGEKELPFVLTEDVAGVMPEFREKDVENVNEVWMNGIRVIPITSDEGYINLVPDTCPTYSFNFRKPIGMDPTGEHNGFQKSDFINAEYYFVIGDEKFKLSGENNLFDFEDAVKKSGLTEDKVLSLQKEYQETFDELNQYCLEAFIRVPALMSECQNYQKMIGYSKVGENNPTFCDTLNNEQDRGSCKQSLTKNKEEWKEESMQFMMDSISED